MLRSSWQALYRRLTSARPRRRSKPVVSAICKVERMESRVLLSAVGPETPVAPTTTLDQVTITPRAVASDANGNYVVTWTEFDNSGPTPTFTSYAQRYDSAGVAQGGRITIIGRDTQVAMDADGDFVISFENGVTPGNRLVHVQVFDENGALQATSQVSSNGNDFGATVAMDDAGNFVVTWLEIAGNNVNLYARRYNSAAAPQGGPVPVAIDPNLINATVAMDANGDFVVAWATSTDIPNGAVSSSTTIRAQRYNSIGFAQGSVIQVSTGITNSQVRPAVAMDSTGNFVVTWAGYNSLDMNAILAQRYNNLGVAQGTTFQVNSVPAIDFEVARPSVEFDSFGNFVVTWQQTGSNVDGSLDIFAQRFDSSGVRLGSEVVVNATTDRQQFSPSVTVDDTGDYVVVWTSRTTTPNIDNVFFQRFDANQGTVGLTGIEPFPLPYAAGGSPVAITSTLIVNGTSTVTAAQIQINGFQSGDTLNFTPMGPISGSFNPGTGIMVLSGVSTPANYQAALRSITYSSPNPGSRSISFQIANVIEVSNIQSRVVGSSAQLVGNILYVYGTLGQDEITVAEAATLDVTVNGVLSQFTPAQVTAVRVYGFDANDDIRIDSLLSGTSLLVFGGLGNDTIDASTLSTNIGVGEGTHPGGIYGGAGNDLIKGGGGDDTLVGWFGNDWIDSGDGSDISIGGTGNDVYAFNDTLLNQDDVVMELANEGTDLLNFTTLTTAVTVNLSSVSTTVATMAHRSIEIQAAGQAANFENVNGGSDNDSITGNSANNVIYGNAGEDTMQGASGNDQLEGGIGNDLLLGGNQNDILKGGDGADSIKGEAGNDFLIGADGNNVLEGGAGNDSYLFDDSLINQTETVIEFAGGGNDLLNFSSLVTVVTANLTSDASLATMAHRIVKTGSAGQAANFENVYGGSANDTITGNAANNVLFGNGGHDNITANGGNDILVGSFGNDTLKGSSGRNILIGGVGADLLQGGSGEDLMMSGSTIYDADPAALGFLLAEWASGSAYQTRIDHILGTIGGGANGTFTLGPATASNDSDIDNLTGGIGRDWFLASSVQDIITDRAVDEVFTHIDAW